MNRIADTFAARLAAGAAFAHSPAGLRLDPADAKASRQAAERNWLLEDAMKAGYEPQFDCTHTGGAGAMKHHCINTAFAMDGKLDVDQLNVLLIEPQDDGSMHLVALECIVFLANWTGKAVPVARARVATQAQGRRSRGRPVPRAG